MATKNRKFDDVEQAYKALVEPLTRYASRHLINQDKSIDAVHNAFQKTVEYINRNPKSKVSEFFLYRETARACRRLNKREERFVPITDIQETY